MAHTHHMLESPATEILIVDDERTMIALLCTLLEDAGFEVLVATNGEEAVSILETHQPSVAIVDKNLPDFSGLEVIRRARPHSPSTEFILITGLPLEGIGCPGRRIGAVCLPHQAI